MRLLLLLFQRLLYSIGQNVCNFICEFLLRSVRLFVKSIIGNGAKNNNTKSNSQFEKEWIMSEEPTVMYIISKHPNKKKWGDTYAAWFVCEFTYTLNAFVNSYFVSGQTMKMRTKATNHVRRSQTRRLNITAKKKQRDDETIEQASATKRTHARECSQLRIYYYFPIHSAAALTHIHMSMAMTLCLFAHFLSFVVWRPIHSISFDFFLLLQIKLNR